MYRSTKIGGIGRVGLAALEHQPDVCDSCQRKVGWTSIIIYDLLSRIHTLSMVFFLGREANGKGRSKQIIEVRKRCAVRKSWERIV
jgi:hypothetical protein